MSTRLLKIQLVVVCFLALWLLASPPKLDYLRTEPASRPLNAVSSNVDGSSRLSSLLRFVGTVQDELAETSPPLFGEVDEEYDGESDQPEMPFPNFSSEVQKVTLNVDVNAHVAEIEKLTSLKQQRRKWRIRWEDRDPSKTNMLQSLIKDGYSWNDTQDEDRRHVIFNRVGKCGSRSIIHLLESLAMKNHFYLISSQTFNKKHISSKHEEELVSVLSSIRSPFIYQRHLHFLNFTKLPEEMDTLNDTFDLNEGEDDKKVIYILQGFIISLFAVLIIATNILNLIVIPRLPDINEASKIFYNCLSSADILLGIVLLPSLPSAIVGGWPFGDVVCKIFGFGMTLVAGLSSGSLLLLNLDRFFSIASPLRYMAIMDRRKALIIVISSGITEATFLLIVLFVNPFGAGIIRYSKLGACIMSFYEPSFLAYSLAIFSLCIWSFIPILAVMYARIICISRRHVRRIQVQELTTRVSKADGSDEPGLPDNKPLAAKKSVNHRAIRMTLLVTGTYVAAWAPFTICQIYISLVKDVSVVVRALVSWPLLLNPLCNVIIYSVTKRSYRIVARNLLKGCLRCSLADIRNASSHEILV